MVKSRPTSTPSSRPPRPLPALCRLPHRRGRRRPPRPPQSPLRRQHPSRLGDHHRPRDGTPPPRPRPAHRGCLGTRLAQAFAPNPRASSWDIEAAPIAPPGLSALSA
eukprot:scaffold7307_cov125-Isochrysis_galbana.AAC.12